MSLYLMVVPKFSGFFYASTGIYKTYFYPREIFGVNFGVKLGVDWGRFLQI